LGGKGTADFTAVPNWDAEMVLPALAARPDSCDQSLVRPFIVS
jgi:hypothetical protein